MSTKAIYQRVAVTDAGDIIPGAEYTVVDEGTGLDLTIYSSRAGASKSPPYFADSNGVIQFYIDPGLTYRVTASGGSGTYTDRYILSVLTGSEPNEIPTNAITDQIRVKSVASIEDMSGLTGVDGQQISVKGYHPGTTVGGDIFSYDASRVRTDHNGGMVISPARDLASEGLAAYLTTSVDTDTGCWVRRDVEYVTPEMFGAVGDETTDDTASVLAAFNFPAVHIPIGRFLVNDNIEVTTKTYITGEGTDLGAGSLSSSVLIKGASVVGDFLNLKANACSIKSVQLEGESGNSGDGLVTYYARVEVYDVSVYGMGRDGIRLGTDVNGANANLFKLEKIRSKYNGRHGLHLSQPSGSLWDVNAGTVIDADLQYNTECGAYLDYCAFNTFINLGCQANGTYGLYATDNSQLHKFFGGDFEVNGRPEGSSVTSYYDFYLSDLSEGNRIIGITCFNFPQTLYIGSDNNTTLDINEGSFAGDQQYAGLMMRNIPSDKPTMFDHYEEGEFTPVIVGATTPGSGTYSTQEGKFTRVGNAVNFTMRLTVSTHTGTGGIRIDDLPFSAEGLTTVTVITSGLTVSQNYFVLGYIIGDQILLKQQRVDTGGSTHSTDLVDIPINATFTVYASGTYFVA